MSLLVFSCWIGGSVCLFNILVIVLMWFIFYNGSRYVTDFCKRYVASILSSSLNLNLWKLEPFELGILSVFTVSKLQQSLHI
ncbi:hypothetical protein NC653_007672 [Populus alba x Populus x berolinensis]|uniref:Uncharacterized protein n=1 Tax=Populus alba x Populus x berolinensis TaxID=444605 RepID=A0AAD6RHH5_9ROSI|nr:hypothetical protein NC653_007672 [Populus alba x Populus x berolinensis]